MSGKTAIAFRLAFVAGVVAIVWFATANLEDEGGETDQQQGESRIVFAALAFLLDFSFSKCAFELRDVGNLLRQLRRNGKILGTSEIVTDGKVATTVVAATAVPNHGSVDVWYHVGVVGAT